MQLSSLVNSIMLGRVSLAHLSGTKLSGDISGCDINAFNNFDRLKAQSKRTIQTLIENRRRLAQRACKFRICGTVLHLIFVVKASARIRKERQKLSNAAWRARRCRS